MTGARAIPVAARAEAARLRELFDRDQELAGALNAAQRDLYDATDLLVAGLSADALRAIYGPTGPDLGLSGRKPAVLADPHPIAALERVAHRIRSATLACQRIADERRHVGVAVGEASARLTAALHTAGFNADEARRADIDMLAAGRFAPVGEHGPTSTGTRA